MSSRRPTFLRGLAAGLAAPLVLLEGVLWLAVLLTVGLAVAGSYEWKLEEPD